MLDVVGEALLDLGVGEDPPHSNAGPCMERFALPGERPASWCGRAVRTWFARAGHPLPGNRWLIPSVLELQMALSAAGAWIDVCDARRDRPPCRGDLIVLNERGMSDRGKGGHHVGLVEAYDAPTGTIHSIDGNWSDVVCRVQRNIHDTDLWGFGRTLEETTR